MSEKTSKQQFMAGITVGLTIVAAMAVVVVAVVGSGRDEPEEDTTSEAESERDGARWIVQTRGVDASIRGLSVVSADVAWASGSGGTWLRTVNGGRVWNWGQVPGAGEMDFRDIEAFDADAACVLAIGRPAAVYCTEDGGRSWSLTYENDTPGIFFNCMDFADRQRGYAVGDPIDGRLQLIRTLDGGLSWHPLDPASPPMPNPGEGQFAASGTCLQVRGDRLWIAGGAAGARVYSSYDGGLNWSATETPLRAGASSQGNYSVALWSDTEGVVVGGDYEDDASSEGNVALTSDGGSTWSRPDGDPPGGYRSGVTVVSAGAVPTLVAVGTSGSDISTDGGQSWGELDATGFHTVAASPDGAVVWAAGSEGRVARLRR